MKTSQPPWQLAKLAKQLTSRPLQASKVPMKSSRPPWQLAEVAKQSTSRPLQAFKVPMKSSQPPWQLAEVATKSSAVLWKEKMATPKVGVDPCAFRELDPGSILNHSESFVFSRELGYSEAHLRHLWNLLTHQNWPPKSWRAGPQTPRCPLPWGMPLLPLIWVFITTLVF